MAAALSAQVRETLLAAEALPAALAPCPRALRVVFCTRGGLFGERVLQRLRACEGIELCGIVRSKRIFDARYGFVRGALEYLRRCGLSYSLYLLCATDIADAFCALGQGRTAPKQAAREPAVPVLATADLNAARGLAFLRACAPDLLVSAFFDQRLREEALAVPARGCVNIHPSLLPAFRGVDPVLQARIQGASRIGVTVHYMTPELDRGNLIAQHAMSMPAKGSVFALTSELFGRGAELLVDSLAKIGRGDPGQPQPPGGSYESWPTRSEVRALRAAGDTLIRLADFR